MLRNPHVFQIKTIDIHVVSYSLRKGSASPQEGSRMKIALGVETGAFRKVCRCAAALWLVWLLAAPAGQQNSRMTLSAQTPPPPYCFTNTSTPPNLGTTAQGIAPNNNAFVSDYNKLSQAAWCSFIALNWAAAGNGSPTMTADASKPLGTCTNLGTTACSLVWETWRSSDQVYNANPLPCSGGPAQPQIHQLRMGNPNTARANPHAPGQFMR